MKKYLLEIKRTGGQIVVGYRDGILVYLEIKEGVTKDQIVWLNKSLPRYDESEFQAFKKFIENKGVSVQEILPDLSFHFFWQSYNNKKGKKARVELLWNAMEDTEKTKALTYIKKYDYYLAENSHVPKKYPQTYLNTAEWNN